MSQPVDTDEATRRVAAAGRPVAPGRAVWDADPTDLALAASGARREAANPEPPGAFCLEVGRRLLLAELQFSSWVLRRVEKVSFHRDHSIWRRISIELNVRDDAPVFRDRSGREFWLVPISMMRRRTLVNLDLRDEDDRSLTTPGIRLQQQFDQSLLLAAAATAPESATDVARADSPVRRFVSDLVAGEHRTVLRRVDEFEAARSDTAKSYLRALRRNATFTAVLHRLEQNFSLYVFLPVERGRHRLLWMSFDEPVDWSYQRARLEPRAAGGLVGVDAEGAVAYRPAADTRRWEWGNVVSALGLRPTRIRFQVPSAENAASYHFEFTAPDGVRIVRAELLAGRPNDPLKHVSADHAPGRGQTVGLHAVEVPHGSLCRAQVDLRVPSRGWLATSVISYWLIFAVLGTVIWHLFLRSSAWSDVQITNVVLLLVSASAGVATLIAQREAGEVALRLVSRIRALGVLAIGLPIIGAGFLIYPNRDGDAAPGTPDRVGLSVLTLVALGIVALATTAWWATKRDERHAEAQSPWNITRESESPPEPVRDYRLALRRFGFETAAVGIKSAEGWHERYAWDDERQAAAVASLAGPARWVSCAEITSTCAERRHCPAGLSRARAD
jgi:hypothetical protein